MYKTSTRTVLTNFCSPKATPILILLKAIKAKLLFSPKLCLSKRQKTFPNKKSSIDKPLTLHINSSSQLLVLCKTMPKPVPFKTTNFKANKLFKVLRKKKISLLLAPLSSKALITPLNNNKHSILLSFNLDSENKNSPVPSIKSKNTSK